MVNEDTIWPVVVVGAGPVGLALAGDLGWRGVNCLVLEQSEGLNAQPKMDLVGVRTMEFCRRWGLVSEVQNCPYPPDFPQDVIFLKDLASGELGRDPFPSMKDDSTPAQSPQKKERCPQNMFDPILRKFAESFDTTQLRYRTRVVSVEDVGDLVNVQIETPSGRATVRARYVVACDGGNSAIRDSLGIRMSGRGVLTYTTNVLFRSATFHTFHHVKPGYRYIFLDERGVWSTIVAINGRDEFRFSIVGDASRSELSDADVASAIERAAGRPFEFDVLSTVRWTRRELVADEYGRGRIFLCGDAAHIMSPTGGFGMNTGVADAVDLSWKLNAVLKGWGGGDLLGTYQAERRPVAVRNVGEAGSNFNRMTSHQGVASLEDLARRYQAAMAPEWRAIGIHLGYRYQSWICVPDGSPAPPDQSSDYVQSASPGCRAPHIWLADGRSTLDFFGNGFSLLKLGHDAPDVSSLTAAAKAAGMPLDVVEFGDQRVAEAYGRSLVLVRPDGHIAWRSDSLPRDAPALIDRIRGQRPAGSPPGEASDQDLLAAAGP